MKIEFGINRFTLKQIKEKSVYSDYEIHFEKLYPNMRNLIKFKGINQNCQKSVIVCQNIEFSFQLWYDFLLSLTNCRTYVKTGFFIDFAPQRGIL